MKTFVYGLIFLFATLLTAQNISFKDEYLLDGVKEGNVSKVEIALGKGANVNCQDADGHTPLMYAAVEGFNEICKILIQAGANIDTQDTEGLTALMFASLENKLTTVYMLCVANADVNIKSNIGATALSFAKYYKYEDVVKVLQN